MGLRWIKTNYPGVRCRVDDAKTGKPDPYYTIRYRANGKLAEEKLGKASEGWTAKKAAGVLAELKAAQTTGKGPQSLAESRAQAREARQAERHRQRIAGITALPFCAAALDYYLPWARRHKHSWPADVCRFERHLWPLIGSVPVRELTRSHVEAMLETVGRKGLAPATVKQCLALARRICNYCTTLVLHGETVLPGKNPCDGVTVRCPDNARLRFLTYEEADRLVEAAQGFDADGAMHDMIVLALNTGMRLGEIQRLRRPDVDLAHALLHVLDRDGKPGGVVYLNQTGLDVLSHRMGSPDGTLVFAPPAGGRVRENISQRFKALADGLGLNDGITDARQRVVFHTLRHTFASWLALGGQDIYTIKALMRHKTITMTMRYAHLIPDVKRRAVARLVPTPGPDGSPA